MLQNELKKSLHINSKWIKLHAMKLKKYLKKHGDSVKMARKLGIHNVYFNAIVNNRRTPSKNLARRISNETGGAVSIIELLFPE